jgi:hypothetical protein
LQVRIPQPSDGRFLTAVLALVVAHYTAINIYFKTPKPDAGVKYITAGQRSRRASVNHDLITASAPHDYTNDCGIIEASSQTALNVLTDVLDDQHFKRLDPES